LNRVRIQSSAEAEAAQAAEWYESQQPGLGIEFLLELDAAIERATETPLAYAPIYEKPDAYWFVDFRSPCTLCTSVML
jgi:hypothetical protein